MPEGAVWSPIGGAERPRRDRVAAVLASMSRAIGAPTPSHSADARSYAAAQFARANRFVALCRPLLPASCSRVLDLGCGEGGDTNYYAQALRDVAAGAVVGVDRNATKLRTAVEQSAGRLAYACADVTALPLADDSIDVAISRDGFEHFMHPEAVLHETRRVLRLGGRLIVSFAPYFGSKGPHLGGFVTVPRAHLLCSARTLARAAELVAARSMQELDEPSRAALAGRLQRCVRQALAGVNHMTIRKWEQLLLAVSGWRLVAYRRYGGRQLHRPLLALPMLRELVASVFAVLEKQPGVRIERADIVGAQRTDVPQVLYV